MADETKPADGIEATPEAARDGAPPPAPPRSALTGAAFAAKAKDLDALRNAVVDAAGVGAGLWLSYLFILFYLAVAVGGVTHRNLLFENPVKLPFLSVDLPLLGFFILGPGLFLIVHAYVLLHFMLLADKVGAFHAELRAQIADEDVRASLRRQLPSNIFVQFLAGPREVRTGIMGFMLKVIALISLVAGPLALLAFFQLQFLPYHHEPIAWWQRLTVVADLVLLWMVWPSIARGDTTGITLGDFRRGKVAAVVLASLAPVLLVFTIATFPGEWLERNLPPVRFVPTKWSTPKSMGWSSLHELLVAGAVDFVARKPTSLWSNRLVLPDIDVIDHAKFDSDAKIAALPESLSLRGRRLEGAVLAGARLRKVDFTAAHLQGATLDDADLREAKFECETDPQRATAQKRCAQLQGASLVGAQLQGALLDNAQLQGASLENAQLQGVSLAGAQLQGASLDDAQLQGTSLVRAQLQGASLENAQLQGAFLAGARLQGASLAGAQLQGASLKDAQLQGASLDDAQLGDALLEGSFVWRADPRNMESAGARVVAPESGPKHRGPDCPNPAAVCDWSAASFAGLKQPIEAQVADENRRAEALQRIAKLDPANPLPGEETMAQAWADLARSSPTPDTYEKNLAERWRQRGCAPRRAPYVIRGLLVNLDARFGSDSHDVAALARDFLDEANCPGARGLSEEEKVRLREIGDRTPSAPAAASPNQ